MNYIGEFQKESMILLELLTKDEQNQSIATDFPPTATIEHYHQNGLQQVENVTLETMGDGSTHTKSYQIPLEWETGEYLITYYVTIGGIEHTVQETFRIMEEAPVIEDIEEDDVENATSIEGYIMPPDFQTASSFEVVGNQIIITMQEPIKYNHTYQVVLDKKIRSISGNKLNESKSVTFTSEYKPLLATPLEVQSLLRSVYHYFTPHDVYSAIRDAGQKAFQLLGRVVDANNSRYREYTERETTYFGTTKYVAYEAARSLLTKLMVQILNGGEDDQLGMMNGSGGSITLGDFSVSDGSESGTSGDTEESQLQKLNALILQTEKELKFWQDAMMGQNRRGYAKPVSGSYRTAAGSPEGRDF